MPFLTRADITVSMRERILSELLSDIDSTPERQQAILDSAVLEAQSEVADYLSQLHDLPAAYATTGADRPLQLIRWVRSLAINNLYKRVDSASRPQAILNDYLTVLELLKEIASGAITTDLPRKSTNPDALGGPAETRFTWGSLPQRSL